MNIYRQLNCLQCMYLKVKIYMKAMDNRNRNSCPFDISNGNNWLKRKRYYDFFDFNFINFYNVQASILNVMCCIIIVFIYYYLKLIYVLIFKL